MATAPAPSISEANLSPSGGLVVPPASKRAVYAVRDFSDAEVRPRSAYREARPAKQPKHLLFGAIYHPLLRMVKPIPVDIVRRQGQFLARFDAADEFGIGPTMSAALEDLGKTVSELFIGLSERHEVLSKDLATLLEKLSRHVAYRKR